MHSQPLLLALAGSAIAAPHLTPRAVTPQFKSATYIGNVTDPTKDRDSCVSVRIGSRAFWNCRDTMAYINGADQLPVYVNTAAWSNLGSGSIKTAAVGSGSTGSNPVLLQTGALAEYFPLLSDMCPSNHGACSDGSRWVNWMNTAPLITQSSSSQVTAYSFIAKTHLSGLTALTPTPAYTLYKQVYKGTTNPNTVPTVSVIASEFWKTGEIGYGDYGAVVSNGYAYLYGNLGAGNPPALARVPVGSIETRSKYQYYYAGKWTSTLPALNDISSNNTIPNAGWGWQGTFYYSTYYTSFIWIGQKAGAPVADFYISTAPAPEGPWISPYLLWQGQNGNGFVGAYSLQAHPGLLPSGNAAVGVKENAIYLTWTQPWLTGPFTNPLVYLQFQ